MIRFFVILTFFVSCSHTPGIESAMKKHVVRKISYWKKYLDLPIESRLAPATLELIEYIALDNEKSGFTERPTSVTPDNTFLKDFSDAVKELPENVKRKMKSKVLAIMFVEKLGGSGYTEVVVDESEKEVSSFIVFDYGVLKNMKANSWATWKENSPFKKGNNFATLKIAGPKDDNRKNALQFLLLHELGHAFSVNENLHPSWLTQPENVSGNYPFFDLSWSINQDFNQYQIQDSNLLPYFGKISFYSHSYKDTFTDRLELYQRLEKSNLPSLYALTGYADDFAESFAIYVHTKILKMPYELTLTQGAKITKVVQNCFETMRCAQKEKIIIDFLN